MIITSTEEAVLILLEKHGKCCQKDLLKEMNFDLPQAWQPTTQQALSGLLKIMIMTGRIRSFKDQSDRRKIFYENTDVGTRILAQLRSRRHQLSKIRIS